MDFKPAAGEIATNKGFFMKTNDPANSAVPVDSATVIIARHAGEDLEILFVRRNDKHEFMGGYFVFPGGQVDPPDCDPDLWENHCIPVSAMPGLMIQEPALPEPVARGLFMAAIRETFEECGILLAVPESGSAFDFTDADTEARFKAYRTRLHGGEISLKDIAVKERLRFAPGSLIPYAHWITPTSQPLRYDTRFFLAMLPDGQQAAPDNDELTETLWLNPGVALDMNRTGRISLAPPTLKTVEEISCSQDARELWAAAMQREILPVLPQPYKENGCLGVKLPHDPEYSIIDFKRPPRPGETSRIVRRDGIWSLVKK